MTDMSISVGSPQMGGGLSFCHGRDRPPFFSRAETYFLRRVNPIQPNFTFPVFLLMYSQPQMYIRMNLSPEPAMERGHDEAKLPEHAKMLLHTHPAHHLLHVIQVTEEAVH